MASPSRKSRQPHDDQHDQGVSLLVPKLKRMRIRPLLGQLRLQKEAEERFQLPPHVSLSLEPERLRATLGLGSHVVLRLLFSPQYPHTPPSITQVAPDSKLPFWAYEEGRGVSLPRLRDGVWSSAMGVGDILRDVIESFEERRALGCGAAAGVEALQLRGISLGKFPPVPLPAVPQLPMPSPVPPLSVPSMPRALA